MLLGFNHHLNTFVCLCFVLFSLNKKKFNFLYYMTLIGKIKNYLCVYNFIYFLLLFVEFHSSTVSRLPQLWECLRFIFCFLGGEHIFLHRLYNSSIFSHTHIHITTTKHTHSTFQQKANILTRTSSPILRGRTSLMLTWF